MKSAPDGYRDYADEAEQAALDWQRARWSGQFRKEVTPLADGSFYWHLFRDGVRVNGGLSRDS